MAWLFAYPADFSNSIVNCSKNAKYPKILDYTLRALDPSIQAVEKIDMVENTYVIRMKNQDLVIQDEEMPIKCVDASDFLKRNTDSLKNAVENDLFSVAPNLELIYEIEDI